ncbi:MAG TPA: hypothetical protein DDY43_03445 [Synechococcales bacterium UBA10510]|nr:hypothetical protein [Synechococcales bacterium UBA10510]
MTPEASRRLGHALQAISSIQRYIANAPLQESLSDDLTRSAVQRQLGIVQEALRVALVEEPFLRQIWPDVDALLEGCARMRDWEHEVALADLVDFVGGDLKVWQGRLAEGLKQRSERDEVGSEDCRESKEVGI